MKPSQKINKISRLFTYWKILFFLSLHTCAHKWITPNTIQDQLLENARQSLNTQCKTVSPTVVVLSSGAAAAMEGIFDAQKQSFRAQVLGPLGMSLANITLEKNQPLNIQMNAAMSLPTADIDKFVSLAQSLGPHGLHAALCGGYFLSPTNGEQLQNKTTYPVFELEFNANKILMETSSNLDNETLVLQARFYKSFWFFQKTLVETKWVGMRQGDRWVPITLEISADSKQSIQILEWNTP